MRVALLCLISQVALALPPVIPPPPPKGPVCTPPQIPGGLGGKCVDPPPPRPATEYGQFVPKFLPLYVVYAPPGRSSSIAYANGDTVGTTVVLTDSNNQSLKVTLGVEGDMLGSARGGLSIGIGSAWGSSRSEQADLTVTQTLGYRKTGQADDINHDDDEIWFLVKPAFRVAATPSSVYGPAKASWSLETGTKAEAYFMYVGELRGTYPIHPTVQEALDRFGMTQRDLKELLKADPLANGSQPNAFLDPRRFEYVATFPYRPVLRPGDVPSTQPYSVARRTANSTTEASSVSFSVDFEIKGGFSFLGLIGTLWKVNESGTITSSSSMRLSTQGDQSSTLTVGQPGYGYTGPTVMRVYVDKTYKTWAYTLDWS